MHLPVSFSEAGVTSVQKTEEHPASFSEAGVTNVQKTEDHCKALLQRHPFPIFSCTHSSLATKSPKKLTKNTTFSICVFFHFLRPSYLTFYDYSRTLNNLGGVVP